jgi:hypothetical protein
MVHDIGLKDILDALHLFDNKPELILFTISIAKVDKIGMGLSPKIRSAVPQVAQEIKTYLESATESIIESLGLLPLSSFYLHLWCCFDKFPPSDHGRDGAPHFQVVMEPGEIDVQNGKGHEDPHEKVVHCFTTAIPPVRGITQEKSLGKKPGLISEYNANPVKIWKTIAKYMKEYTISARAFIPLDLIGSLQIRRMSMHKT